MRSAEGYSSGERGFTVSSFTRYRVSDSLTVSSVSISESAAASASRRRSAVWVRAGCRGGSAPHTGIGRVCAASSRCSEKAQQGQVTVSNAHGSTPPCPHTTPARPECPHATSARLSPHARTRLRHTPARTTTYRCRRCDPGRLSSIWPKFQSGSLGRTVPSGH